MGRKAVKLSDQIRRAVDESGVSRGAICRTAGIDEALMSRFMSGAGGLSVASLDALAGVLGLNVVATGKRAKFKIRPRGRPRKGR